MIYMQMTLELHVHDFTTKSSFRWAFCVLLRAGVLASYRSSSISSYSIRPPSPSSLELVKSSLLTAYQCIYQNKSRGDCSCKFISQKKVSSCAQSKYTLPTCGGRSGGGWNCKFHKYNLGIYSGEEDYIQP
jgi:hypothetical protein